MKFFFKVKSSSRDFNTVSIHNRNGLIYLKCDCQAGSFLKFCKHKFAVARGDVAILLEPPDSSDWATAQQWLKATAFPTLLEECHHHEQIAAARQKELKRLRAQLEHYFKTGLK
ncbi:MAG: hypothetical protein PHZ19_08005 [Candidatus Thermoplasmatota archaeon]|nr:hypothetical protein [Candidatus Thermoplasmatota archaeon]